MNKFKLNSLDFIIFFSITKNIFNSCIFKLLNIKFLNVIILTTSIKKMMEVEV